MNASIPVSGLSWFDQGQNVENVIYICMTPNPRHHPNDSQRSINHSEIDRNDRHRSASPTSLRCLVAPNSSTMLKESNTHPHSHHKTPQHTAHKSSPPIPAQSRAVQPQNCPPSTQGKHDSCQRKVRIHQNRRFPPEGNKTRNPAGSGALLCRELFSVPHFLLPSLHRTARNAILRRTHSRLSRQRLRCTQAQRYSRLSRRLGMCAIQDARQLSRATRVGAEF